MGGWVGSTRRQRLPKNWASLRRRVIRRDGGQCTATYSDGRRCEQPGTDVDHIVPDSLGGSDALENLALLCTWHHARKSSAEGGRAAAATRVVTARPHQSHPAFDD
ncbi:HNH endonuclease [Streptomyces sp. PanSC19]|uniref:HNH endonuclease n=1 Tax=Streptomyces sp. PanSC19 TaxID=1520455 RepID=UPI000F4A69A8|nr:HNH endonuclease signature motif containing protein [Streptomyces sp. PanSC19]ROQ27118.1 HNH endonuclease [Streptomyces sp. PanSC19]